MKVLKFGGSSVGSVTGLHNIKKIAESSDQPLIIVVSALGGITDKLIALGKRAATGDIAYIGDLDAIIRRHLDLVKAEIAEDKQAALMTDLESLFHDLRSILHGVCLIQDLTQKTADAIVAFGERLSSLIFATFIDGAKHYDSRTLFKTTRQGEKHLVDYVWRL